MKLKSNLITFLSATALWITPIIWEIKNTFANDFNVALNKSSSTLVINPDYVWKTRDLQVWWDEIHILYRNDKVLIKVKVDLQLAMENHHVFEWYINWEKYKIVILNDELSKDIKENIWNYSSIKVLSITTIPSKID